MKCELCNAEATCTVTMNVAQRPYHEDKPLCDHHAALLRAIVVGDGEGSA